MSKEYYEKRLELVREKLKTSKRKTELYAEEYYLIQKLKELTNVKN